MMLPKRLMDRIRDVDSEITKYVHQFAKPGQLIKWKRGKYEGRMAKVIHITYDGKSGEVIAWVKTMNKRGNDYLADNDYFHRCGWTLAHFFDVPEGEK